MMDLSLDHKQAKTLDCQECDPQKMRLRNCNGAYGEKSQSPIIVNGNLYRSCPRAMVAQDWELGLMLSLYFECRDNKTSPYGDSLVQSTAFCKEVFDQMDSIVIDFKTREQNKADEKMKRESDKMKAKKGR